MRYFDKHPIIDYNGTPCRNILARADLTEATRKNTVAFYPYTAVDAERPDNLAYNYYDDPDYAWLVFMSNQIIDPYFDYPMTDEQFNRYIVSKYGSVAKAQRMVKFYRNAWASDSTRLTVAGYAAKPTVEKKYWSPAVGENGNIIEYVRKQVDWIYETARIEKLVYSQREQWGTYNIDIRGAGRFQVGDLVMNQPTVAASTEFAIVAAAATSTFILHKFTTIDLEDSVIGGDWYKYDDPDIYEDDTNFAESAITYNPESFAVNVAAGLPAAEAAYYEVVTEYQYEYEQNERRKEMVLVDKQYAKTLSNELRKILKPK